jgi:hypothetical protein
MPVPPASTGPRPRSPFRIQAILAGVVVAVFVLGVVFALGRWSADAPAPVPQPTVPLAMPEPPRAETPAPPAARPAPPAPKAAEPPPSPAPPRAVTPELVARVTESTRREIEKLRPYIVSRCWPEAGLAGGRQSARVILKITFDARGREIARGVSEDRSAPAGEFGSCLLKLEGTSLSIDPPGANVGVSLPVTFP